MRPTFRSLIATAVVISAAGCGETATAPVATSSHLALTSAPAFDFSGGGSRSFGDQSSSFTVTRRGGTFSVNGLFSVNFPANSVCSPDRSTYGPTEWDTSCSTLARGESVTITAHVRLTPTGLAVDFSPGLRFSPSAQVTLSTTIFSSVLTGNSDYFSRNHSALSFLAMGYSQSLGASGLADYSSDPTVLTHVDLSTGVVWRRVKHFSGYYVGSGDSCTPSPDAPDCILVTTTNPAP